MQGEREEAVSWLREHILKPDTPSAVREELKRILQAFRQMSEDEVEDLPPADDLEGISDTPVAN